MRVPLNELLLVVSTALDYVENELLGITSNHSKRAAYVSLRICRDIGLSEIEISDMAGCAILHDNALTEYMMSTSPIDWQTLEQFEYHCRIGERNARGFPFAGDVRNIIREHHENWDGSGFHGLKGEAIPLRSTVLRLADNMDLELAMGNNRPDLEGEIRAHVQKHAGILYAPKMVDALLGILDADFLRKLADDRINESLREEMPVLHKELSPGRVFSLCELFSRIIDAKSPFTRNHSTGVAALAGRLAPYFGIEGEQKNELMIAGYLHDLGKLAVPRTLLEKIGPLSVGELQVMREHAAVTGKLLSMVHGLGQIPQWCEDHHEKLNGSGYPRGICPPRLAFESQIIAACDIYQALTEDRPYRDGISPAEALGVIEGMVGKGELNPDIVAKIRLLVL